MTDLEQNADASMLATAALANLAQSRRAKQNLVRSMDKTSQATKDLIEAARNASNHGESDQSSLQHPQGNDHANESLGSDDVPSQSAMNSHLQASHAALGQGSFALLP